MLGRVTINWLDDLDQLLNVNNLKSLLHSIVARADSSIVKQTKKTLKKSIILGQTSRLMTFSGGTVERQSPKRPLGIGVYPQKDH